MIVTTNVNVEDKTAKKKNQQKKWKLKIETIENILNIHATTRILNISTITKLYNNITLANYIRKKNIKIIYIIP